MSIASHATTLHVVWCLFCNMGVWFNSQLVHVVLQGRPGEEHFVLALQLATRLRDQSHFVLETVALVENDRAELDPIQPRRNEVCLQHVIRGETYFVAADVRNLLEHLNPCRLGFYASSYNWV